VKGDPCRFLAYKAAALINAGEGHTQVLIAVQIAAANERNVLGDPQSPLENAMHRTHGHRIVEAKDAIGPRVKLEQLLQGLVPSLASFNIALALRNDVLGPQFHPIVGHCPLIALQSVPASAGLRPTNVGDAFAPNVNEVLSRNNSRGFVVHPDKIG